MMYANHLKPVARLEFPSSLSFLLSDNAVNAVTHVTKELVWVASVIGPYSVNLLGDNVILLCQLCNLLLHLPAHNVANSANFQVANMDSAILIWYVYSTKLIVV